MAKKWDIMITGCGGQGILLASEIIAEAAMLEGYDIKKADVHGMAQRGGSVISTVRIADKVYSPLIKYGDADILLAFELLEGYRVSKYVRDDGVFIVNTQRINPMPVASGREKYPEGLEDKIKCNAGRVVFLNALDIAKELGNFRAVNVVMIGVLSRFIDLKLDSWKKAIERLVPAKHLELNMKAFEKGREVVG